MTSSQPPQPPGGYGPPPQGGQPGYGQPGFPPPGAGQPPHGQQPGQPAYGQQPGQPPYGPPGQPQPAPGQPPYGPPGYGQQPGFNPYGQPAGTGSGFSFDASKLKMAHYVLAGATLVYLILAILPWVSFGTDYYFYSGSVSGFAFSGLVTFSFVLFLLATAWAVLPAFYDLKLGFPRGWITFGVAALGALLTLIAWINTLSWGFSIWALLGFVVALAIAGFAFLTLLPELKNRPALPGGLANAAQWANQQAPDLTAQFGGQQGGPGQPYGQQPPAGPPPQPYAPPQQPYAPPAPAAPGTTPSSTGGASTGSGSTPPPPPYGQPGGTPGSTGSPAPGSQPGPEHGTGSPSTGV